MSGDLGSDPVYAHSGSDLEQVTWLHCLCYRYSVVGEQRYLNAEQKGENGKVIVSAKGETEQWTSGVREARSSEAEVVRQSLRGH